MDAQYEGLALKKPPKDDVLDANITLSTRDHIDFVIDKKQERGIVLAVSAIKWSYPGRASLYHLNNLEKELKDGNMSKYDAKTFCIDQEKDRPFCKQHGIMVGVPTLECWFQSEPIYFQRNGWKTSAVVCGPFNYDQYAKIIKLITRAIANAQKTQTALSQIDVDFLDDNK